jgi:DNA-binding protein YbaB
MSEPTPTGGDAVDPALDRWVADAEAMAVRYQQLSVEMAHVSVAETTPDGLITVTVNSGGQVTDVRITDRASNLPGNRIAAGLLLAMRRAQSRIAGQVAEVMRSTIGDDPTMVDAVLNRYHTMFPAPPEPNRPGAVEEVRIADENRDTAPVSPAPRPLSVPGAGSAAVRVPATAEPWDGDNHSFLEEVD